MWRSCRPCRQGLKTCLGRRRRVRSPSRLISAKPRVISAARVLSPAPSPSPIPTAMAMMFFKHAAQLTSDDVAGWYRLGTAPHCSKVGCNRERGLVLCLKREHTCRCLTCDDFSRARLGPVSTPGIFSVASHFCDDFSHAHAAAFFSNPLLRLITGICVCGILSAVHSPELPGSGCWAPQSVRHQRSQKPPTGSSSVVAVSFGCSAASSKYRVVACAALLT